MRRVKSIILFTLLALLFPVFTFAAGTAVISTPTYLKGTDGAYNRCVVPITFTADGSAGEGTATLNPVTYGIRGWYLWLVETDPGTPGPTNGAWDLDITNANSFLVSQNLIDDRSSSATQQVKGTTLGYPMITNTWSITIGDNAVNNAVAVVYLTFVSN